MKADMSEDLGEITSHRAFMPGLVWLVVIAVACCVVVFESLTEPASESPAQVIATSDEAGG